MTEYQVTRWRELPSMVTAREGEETAKVQLAPRFQEAIDEAAMRLGDTGATDYLEGWARTPWTGAEGAPAEVLDRVAAELVHLASRLDNGRRTLVPKSARTDWGQQAR